MIEDINNLLSAQCAVITVISILYGLWYSEITKKIFQPINYLRDDEEWKIKEIIHLKWCKILPLFILTLFNGLCFLNPFITLIIEIFKDDNFNAFTYSSIKYSSLLVFIINLIFLVIITVWFVYGIYISCKYKLLKYKRNKKNN